LLTVPLFCNTSKADHAQLTLVKSIDKYSARITKGEDMELVKSQLTILLTRTSKIEDQVDSNRNEMPRTVISRSTTYPEVTKPLVAQISNEETVVTTNESSAQLKITTRQNASTTSKNLKAPASNYKPNLKTDFNRALIVYLKNHTTLIKYTTQELLTKLEAAAGHLQLKCKPQLAYIYPQGGLI
ncbi:unnamed protein product, partial [Didymodactylos carnosus]